MELAIESVGDIECRLSAVPSEKETRFLKCRRKGLLRGILSSFVDLEYFFALACTERMTLRKAKAIKSMVVEARTKSVRVTVRKSGRKGKEGNGRILLVGWTWQSRYRSRWKGIT